MGKLLRPSDEFCLEIRKRIVAKDVAALKKKKARIIKALEKLGWTVFLMPEPRDEEDEKPQE